jgi:DNA-binding winged helix-turn-helix (wHTH) protein
MVTPGGHQFPPFRLDAVNQCLWRGTDQISLSPKAFSVLLYLAERQGRLVTKQELLDAVWPDIHVTEGVLKRAVLEIRKALDDDPEEPRFIQTLHRRGYRFLSTSAAEETTVSPAPEDSGIVGRAREFRQLDGWFESSIQSSRQLVFISGEAGLGKTTLVETWMRGLPRRGVVSETGGVALARGRCLQQFGSGEPYLPVFEALDQLGQTLGRRLVDHLRSRAPTWLLHMPALISLEDRIKLRDEVFGSTRERMLREIADALEALSAEIPVVMVLEDLHWSDPSTIDLLAWIARRTSPARLMILATYRPSDAGGAASPLLVAQNELKLHRQCQVLPLDYFSESETNEYVSARVGADTPELAAALHRRTNGNPLYVVCLVDELERAGKISGDPGAVRHIVPETLQQMFERQSGQLDARAQEMLEMAAVAGEAFSVAGVAAALNRDAAEVESQCDELVRRNVILKPGEGFRFPDGNESPGYSFLHALCRDALYRKLPTGKRSRLHGMLALAEEKLYESDPKRIAAELAGHFELSGDIARAIRYLRTAAERADSRQSKEEALRYLDRALSLVNRLREDDRPVTRMDLLQQRALMRMSYWDLQGAVVDYQEVVQKARNGGAPDRESQALLESVHALMILDYRKALTALEEGQAALSGAPDPVTGGMLELCRHFTNMYLYGWSPDCDAAFEAAIQTVRSLNEPALRARISVMEAALAYLSGRFATGCEKAEESRRFSRKAGSFFEYFAGTLFLHWAALHRGDIGGSLRVANEGRELARRNGSVLPGLWLTMRSNWSEMEAFSFEKPLAVYEQHAATPGILAQRHNFPMLLFLGHARLGAGKLDEAWEAMERLHAAINEGGFPFQLVCPLENLRAECAIARQNRAHGRELAESLIHIATAHRELSYLARGHRLLAELDLSEGNAHSAAAHVAQAEAALAECEAWNVEWRVHATAARVMAHLHRPAESAAARERSVRVADRVAATLDSEPELRESFLAGVDRELQTVRATSV